jgi:hypothetical protein
MALIGQARAKLGASFPLIGVTAGGTVKPDDSTVGRAAVASLEPNHTHVVLVPGARWGDESSWLADVASWVAGDAPSVTVVVNGGEVTVGDAERSVAAGRPVLVVAGSGRAADELAAALQEPSQDQWAGKLSGSGLVEAVDLADGPHAITSAVAAVLTTAPARAPALTGAQDRLKSDFDQLIAQLRLSELHRRFLRSRWLDQLVWVEGRPPTTATATSSGGSSPSSVVCWCRPWSPSS